MQRTNSFLRVAVASSVWQVMAILYPASLGMDEGLAQIMMRSSVSMYNYCGEVLHVARAHAHTHDPSPSLAAPHAGTRAHTHTRTHTRTRARARTHTHTQSLARNSGRTPRAA
eukprot:6180689-Pleurochrysis_carterae.AAC.2